MSDQLDDASELEEIYRQSAIQTHQATVVRLVATGTCLNCDEPLPAGAFFCDADCTHDYERRDLAQRRNGDRQHGITE